MFQIGLHGPIFTVDPGDVDQVAFDCPAFFSLILLPHKIDFFINKNWCKAKVKITLTLHQIMIDSILINYDAVDSLRDLKQRLGM